MPRICGLYICMKSYQKSIPARNWNNLNELCPDFKLIMDLWLAQHPDADIYDKKQMANEIDKAIYNTKLFCIMSFRQCRYEKDKNKRL